MTRNLHHSCSTERIKNELRSKELKVIDVMNKISWKNKTPLNMFILIFSSDENINRIYELSNILGCKVTIEPIKKSRLIAQCKKCQAYGHTQRYCCKKPR